MINVDILWIIAGIIPLVAWSHSHNGENSCCFLRRVNARFFCNLYVFVIRHHEMNHIAAFCDNFSTKQPMTLNKISLESLGQCRQYPVQMFNLHMENMTPLPFLVSVYISHSQKCQISCRFWPKNSKRLCFAPLNSGLPPMTKILAMGLEERVYSIQPTNKNEMSISRMYYKVNAKGRIISEAMVPIL
jgi:hypothetical protein